MRYLQPVEQTIISGHVPGLDPNILLKAGEIQAKRLDDIEKEIGAYDGIVTPSGNNTREAAAQWDKEFNAKKDTIVDEVLKNPTASGVQRKLASLKNLLNDPVRQAIVQNAQISKDQQNEIGKFVKGQNKYTASNIHNGEGFEQWNLDQLRSGERRVSADMYGYIGDEFNKEFLPLLEKAKSDVNQYLVDNPLDPSSPTYKTEVGNLLNDTFKERIAGLVDNAGADLSNASKEYTSVLYRNTGKDKYANLSSEVNPETGRSPKQTAYENDLLNLSELLQHKNNKINVANKNPTLVIPTDNLYSTQDSSTQIKGFNKTVPVKTSEGQLKETHVEDYDIIQKSLDEGFNPQDAINDVFAVNNVEREKNGHYTIPSAPAIPAERSTRITEQGWYDIFTNNQKDSKGNEVPNRVAAVTNPEQRQQLAKQTFEAIQAQKKNKDALALQQSNIAQEAKKGYEDIVDSPNNPEVIKAKTKANDAKQKVEQILNSAITAKEVANGRYIPLDIPTMLPGIPYVDFINKKEGEKWDAFEKVANEINEKRNIAINNTGRFDDHSRINAQFDNQIKQQYLQYGEEMKDLVYKETLKKQGRVGEYITKLDNISKDKFSSKGDFLNGFSLVGLERETVNGKDKDRFTIGKNITEMFDTPLELFRAGEIRGEDGKLSEEEKSSVLALTAKDYSFKPSQLLYDIPTKKYYVSVDVSPDANGDVKNNKTYFVNVTNKIVGQGASINPLNIQNTAWHQANEAQSEVYKELMPKLVKGKPYTYKDTGLQISERADGRYNIYDPLDSEDDGNQIVDFPVLAKIYSDHVKIAHPNSTGGARVGEYKPIQIQIPPK